MFSYMPLHKNIESVKQIKNAQMLVIARGKADTAQMPLVEGQLSTLQTELESYQTRIPGPGELGTFIRQIADLMDKNNLKEQQINPGVETQQDELFCIPVRIQCKGGLSEIFKFSQQLQNLDRQIRIETARFENDDQYSGVIGMNTEIVIYYRTNVTQG